MTGQGEPADAGFAMKNWLALMEMTPFTSVRPYPVLGLPSRRSSILCTRSGCTAAPPPPRWARLEVSRRSKSGLLISSRTMVGTPVKVDGRSLSISSRAVSGFQRCMRVRRPPTAVIGCKQQLQPVTWNSGTARTEPGYDSPGFLSEPGGGSPAAMAMS